MSRSRGPVVLVLAALPLTASSAWLAWTDSESLERPFQGATGGVGLSSAVSPAWSFHSFDPRLESLCENELRPIPGLACPDPTHGATIADYPLAPLDEARDPGGSTR